MIRDITLGQYYAAKSPVHRLDARVKIIAILLFITELFIADDFAGFAMLAAALLITVAVSGVPLGYIFRGMKPIMFILLFTFLLNIFMVDGRVIWRVWIFKVTLEGIYVAIFMAARLIMIIIASSLLTFTTRPIALTDGLERLLSPLAKLKVPTHDIAMMMSIALRFIPTLTGEADRIMKAQQARGADFESGNVIRRGRAMIPVIIPLFVSAFRIAGDLAVAMEARCYQGGEGRTSIRNNKFNKRDIIVLALCFTLFAATVVLRNL